MEDNNLINQTDYKPWGMDLNPFCMLMHLSLFLTPILTLIMWLTNKDKNEKLDQHGKNLMNWVISSIIYGIVSGILCFVFIGFVLIFGLVICQLIFIILGAIKANDGEVYIYPLAIKFIN